MAAHLAVGIAQQPVDTSTLQVEAILVPVDVSVLDTHGRPVADLRAEDFVVYEDGQVQKVRSFQRPLGPSEVASTTSSSAASSAVVLASTPQTVVFALDELSTRYEDMAFARSNLEHYLQQHGGGSGVRYILLAMTAAGLQRLTPWTNDAASLITALHARHPALPSRLRIAHDTAATSERLGESVLALENIAQFLEGEPGVKQVLWLGHGFPSLSIYDLDADDADTMRNTMRKTSSLLLTARIRLSVIDPAGVSATEETAVNEAGVDTGTSRNSFDPASSFEGLPQQTGGRFVSSRNDLDHAIEQEIAAVVSVYSLTYSPANKVFDGRFRRIQVVVRRPQLVLRTRDGYFADRYRSNPPGTVGRDLAEALESPLPCTGLSFTATWTQAGTAVGELIVHIDSRNVVWRPLLNGQQRAEFTVVVRQQNAAGKVLQSVAKELAVTLAKPGLPVVLRLPVSVYPDVHSLRIAARDANSTQIGTADIAPVHQK